VANAVDPAQFLVGSLNPCLEVRPDILAHLGCKITHAMRQAALEGGTREATSIALMMPGGELPFIGGPKMLGNFAI